MKPTTVNNATDVHALQVILIDDEPLAIQKLRHFIKGQEDVEILDECSNGQDALKSIRELKPDLIFLDIQMPEMDGFAMLRELSDEEMPRVIFVTAYDEFALRAFEVHAIDYLLKPFDRARFEEALSHARELLVQKPQAPDELHTQLRSLLDVMGQSHQGSGRLMIKCEGRVLFMKTDDIDWFEAAGNYIKVHCGSETHLLRETMSSLLTQLDPAKFLRIHRGTIVNLDRIREMHPWFNGEYKIFLTTNAQLIMSRGCHEQFIRTFGKPL
ncbi:MAG: LytR/AlgR family response regulator transcription factor [Acidobacteriota bacterium]